MGEEGGLKSDSYYVEILIYFIGATGPVGPLNTVLSCCRTTTTAIEPHFRKY
jgi:hypothetical protein